MTKITKMHGIGKKKKKITCLKKAEQSSLNVEGAVTFSWLWSCLITLILIKNKSLTSVILTLPFV